MMNRLASLLLFVFALCAFGGQIVRKDIVDIEKGVIVSVGGSVLYDNKHNSVERLPYSPIESGDSTKGVLYHIDDTFSCVPAARDEKYFGNNYVRIALISLNTCSIKSQIEQAILDGSKGAVVYNVSSSVDKMEKKFKTELVDYTPKIPVFMISENAGSFLRRQLLETALENNFKTKDDKMKYLFVTLMSDENAKSGEQKKSSSWKTIMIIFFILVSGSLLYLIVNHLRKKGNKYNDLAQEKFTGFGLQKQRTLSISALKKLELKRITEKDVAKQSARSASVSSMLISTKFKKGGRLESKVLDGLKGITMCSMCVDDFVVGSELRKLPCGHKFHSSCVDPWLLKHSALCPICKYDTRSVLGPEYSENLRSFDEISLVDIRKNSYSHKKSLNEQQDKGVVSKFKDAFKTAKNMISRNNQNESKTNLPERTASFQRPKFNKNSRSIKVNEPILHLSIHSSDLHMDDPRISPETSSSNRK
ncbi:hypothetical protein BB558_000846 [Smittium angustum]|uniref:RING-type E3 ubiquitin transferase n=1 Tax=Smittium angustum TaxID=133377 RepID=A0A2U1JDE1_SMIAN|nr:hypothetical protein BB558_000846 [Smittium angustum]